MSSHRKYMIIYIMYNDSCCCIFIKTSAGYKNNFVTSQLLQKRFLRNILIKNTENFTMRTRI